MFYCWIIKHRKELKCSFQTLTAFFSPVCAINSPSERAVKGSDPLLHDNSHLD